MLSNQHTQASEHLSSSPYKERKRTRRNNFGMATKGDRGVRYPLGSLHLQIFRFLKACEYKQLLLMRSGLLELISQPSNSSVYKAILQHNKATYICFRNLLFEEEKNSLASASKSAYRRILVGTWLMWIPSANGLGRLLPTKSGKACSMSSPSVTWKDATQKRNAGKSRTSTVHSTAS